MQSGKINEFLAMHSGACFCGSLCRRLTGSRPAELTAEGMMNVRGVVEDGKISFCADN